MKNTIEVLDGEFAFLSNFHPSPFVDNDGVSWDTVEHFFQAMKSEDINEREFVRGKLTAGRAKRAGRKVTLRFDWEDIKEDIMLKGLTFKFFQNKELGNMLLTTEDMKITEGNSWHDNFWGVCNCGNCVKENARNVLGKSLMIVRARLTLFRNA